jgi:hypothetical protein
MKAGTVSATCKTPLLAPLGATVEVAKRVAADRSSDSSSDACNRDPLIASHGRSLASPIPQSRPPRRKEKGQAEAATFLQARYEEAADAENEPAERAEESSD